MSDNKKQHTGHMTMVEKRRRNILRLERLPRVVKAYLQGNPVREIARREKLTTNIINKDLYYARKMWRKQAEKSAEEYLDHQLEKLNLVESEAWAAWEQSKLDAEERSSEKDADGKVKRKRVRKGQYGDPRFLDVARKCVDDRCKLLKIGQYGTEESLAAHARTVEVVVETTQQVNRMMSYEQFEELGTSEN